MVEERISQQAGATSILSENLQNPSRRRTGAKVWRRFSQTSRLTVGREGGGTSTDVVKSFRATTAFVAISKAIKNGDNLAAATEFLVLLYSL